MNTVQFLRAVRRALCSVALAATALAAAADERAFIIDDDDAFWDADIGLSNGAVVPAELAQLFRAYLGGLGRLPDESGFAWWAREIAAGRHDLRSMAAGFVHSEEFLAAVDVDRDGALAADELLAHIYNTVFGRAPDPQGYSWWAAELASGRRSATDVLLDMTQSNEFVQLTLEPLAVYVLGGRRLPGGEIDFPPALEPPPL